MWLCVCVCVCVCVCWLLWCVLCCGYMCVFSSASVWFCICLWVCVSYASKNLCPSYVMSLPLCLPLCRSVSLPLSHLSPTPPLSLSSSLHPFPFLSLSLSVCLCLSLSLSICPYLSLSLSPSLLPSNSLCHSFLSSSVSSLSHTSFMPLTSFFLFIASLFYCCIYMDA